MKTLLLLTVTACLAATSALAGEFKFTVSASFAEGQDKVLDATTFSVEPDPFWGKGNQEEYDKHVKLHGKPPVFTVSGTGTSKADAEGNVARCVFDVTVTWDDDQKIPTTLLRQADGSELELQYVYVRVVATRDGFYSQYIYTRALEARETLATMGYANKWPTYTGKLFYESSHKPYANKTVRIVGLSQQARIEYAKRGLTQADTVYEFDTDEDGSFKVTGNDIPALMGRLILDDTAWAPSFSAPWCWSVEWIHRRKKANNVYDLGGIPIVPAGGLTVSVVDDTTSEAVESSIQVRLPNRAGELHFYPGGEVVLPVGQYGLQVQPVAQTDVVYETNRVIAANVVHKVSASVEYRLRRLNDVDISIVDPDGNKLQNVGQSRRGATLTSLEKSEFAHASRRRGYQSQFSARADRNGNFRFQRIPTGKFQLFVQVKGYTHDQIHVVVTENMSVTVHLTKGSAFEVVDHEIGHFRSICAIHEESILHDPIAEALRNNSLMSDWNQLVSGVARFWATGYVSNSNPTLMPHGRYLILFRGRNDVTTLYVDVGESDKSFRVHPPNPKGQFEKATWSFLVQATHNGEPLIGYEVLLIEGQFGNGKTLMSAKTEGPGGLARFVGPRPNISVCVFGKDEKARIDSVQHLTTESFPVRVSAVLETSPKVFKMELSDTLLSDRCVCDLTLEARSEDVKLVGVQEFRSLSHTALSGDRYGRSPDGVDRPLVRRSTETSDGAVIVHSLPLGCYRWIGQAALKGNKTVSFTRYVTVTSTGTQTAELDITYGACGVQVTSADASTSIKDVTLEVVPVDHWGGVVLDAPKRYFLPTTDKDGKANLTLEHGEYIIVARRYTYTEQHKPVLADVAHARCTVGADSSTCAIKFGNPTGSIKISAEGVPTDRRVGTRFVLTNAKGSEVFASNPYDHNGSLNTPTKTSGTFAATDWIIDGVPAGTYTATIYADGFTTITKSGVTITNGKQAVIEYKLAKALVVKVMVTKLPTLAMTKHITLLDATGDELKSLRMVDRPKVYAADKDNEHMVEFEISTLSASVTKLVVKIPGSEDLEIAIDRKSGDSQSVGVTYTAKTK